jgi:hypothetical protein
LESFQFDIRDVCAITFFKAEHEKPSGTLSGSDQVANPTVFSSTGEGNTLLKHITALVSIDQTLCHLSNRLAKCKIRQFGLAHLAGKVTSFEDAAYDHTMPLGVIDI